VRMTPFTATQTGMLAGSPAARQKIALSHAAPILLGSTIQRLSLLAAPRSANPLLQHSAHLCFAAPCSAHPLLPAPRRAHTLQNMQCSATFGAESPHPPPVASLLESEAKAVERTMWLCCHSCSWLPEHASHSRAEKSALPVAHSSAALFSVHDHTAPCVHACGFVCMTMNVCVCMYKRMCVRMWCVCARVCLCV